MSSTTIKTTEKDIFDYWKSNNISEAQYEFDCGGDSMNHTELRYFDKEGNDITDVINKEDDNLNQILEDRIWKNITFYENSDGHYIGEFGKVIVTLDEDMTDEELEDENADCFNYVKEARSEWNENESEIITIDSLTEQEVSLLQKYVRNIAGGSSDRDVVNYKIDCILTDEEEKLIENIGNKIENFICDYDFDVNKDWEHTEYYTYNTDLSSVADDESELVFKEGKLQVYVENEYRVYTDSED